MRGRQRARQLTEAQVVERARNNVRHVERWGRWWAAFHWMVAIAYVVVIVWVWNLVLGWGNNLAQNRADLWLGFIFGAFAGAGIYNVGHAVIESTLSRMPDQRDRLLLAYHDALRELLAEQPGAPSEATGNGD